MTTETTIDARAALMTEDDLASAWLAAKSDENAANARRLSVEQEIIKRFGVQEEGARTHALPSGPKIEITGKLTYKCDDMDKLGALMMDVEPQLRPIKTKIELDATGCKYLRANKPEVWQQIAPAITTKAAKPAVVVKI